MVSPAPSTSLDDCNVARSVLTELLQELKDPTMCPEFSSQDSDEQIDVDWQNMGSHFIGQVSMALDGIAALSSSLHSWLECGPIADTQDQADNSGHVYQTPYNTDQGKDFSECMTTTLLVCFDLRGRFLWCGESSKLQKGRD